MPKFIPRNDRLLLAVFAGLFMVFVVLAPQARLIYLRGGNWNGNYALYDADEMAYAAYLQALIDGRPRINDPYTKLEDSKETPLPESLFSIQFVTPYVVSVPARIAGASAPTTTVVTGAVFAFFAAIAAFGLIYWFTGNAYYSFAGTLIIFCCGALASGQGAIFQFLHYRLPGPFFPAFRRYLPAVLIPLVFLFWRLALELLQEGTSIKRRVRDHILASVCFGVMVFSYFYIWTAMAAWMLCLFGLWLLFRPEGWRRHMVTLLTLCGLCFVWLIPYCFLLSNRSPVTDEVQLLVLTHSIDLVHVPEFIGWGVLVFLAGAVLSKRVDIKDHKTLFTLSLALLPTILANQQVITGRQLQSNHYDLYIANYAALLAVVLSLKVVFLETVAARENPVRSVSVILVCSLAAAGWGIVECYYTARLFDRINIDRDQEYAIAKYLRASNEADPLDSGSIISFNEWVADDLPTTAPQSVLWSIHQNVFGNVTKDQNRERYYQYLYFRGNGPAEFYEKLRENEPNSVITLFGADRHNNYLTSKFAPLTDSEIESETNKYSEYISTFDPRNSPGTILSFLVLPNNRAVDTSNIDKWYDRSEIGVFEQFTLYRLTLRQR